jgi:hypothetical protein
MSLADLRKELREIRKTAPSVPISKMKKHEVVLELEGHKKTPAKVEVVEEIPVAKEKKAPAPKKVVEKKVVEEVKEKKAPAPKKEKVVKVKEEVKVEKVSVKSAPRKKKAE